MAKLNLVQKSYLLENKRLDADFFQKEYIELDKIINGAISIQRSANTVDLQSNGAFRVIFEILNDNQPKEVPYIRSGNVGDFFISKEELHSISKLAHSKLRKTHTQIGDILMARKGKIGGATLITEDDVNYNSNDNVTNIRLKNYDFLPAYFVAFWNSKFGLQQVERFATGNVQPWLSMKQIRMLRTVKLNYEFQKEVSDIVMCAYHKNKLSQTLYKQATDFLEQELGLDKISFVKPKSYRASFSEAINFSRIDSEHYQPRYRKIREIITNYPNGYERLLANITAVKASYNLINHPSYKIQYIELSNINPAMGYIDKIESMNKADAPSRAKRIVQSGDVIASSVVGSVDKAGLVSETENGFIASNGFFQFRSSYYSPEFLLLIIKSNIVKEQFQQQSTGGILSAVPDQNLKHILIPKISSEIQNKITDLVRNSHKYIKQSQQLLADAKSRVEQLIEEAANK